MNKKTYLFGGILMFTISSVVVLAQQGTNQQADERVVTATNQVTVIARELREQYTIGFYSSRMPSTRDWHRIKIVLNEADAPRGLRLSYRQGYRRVNR